MIDLSTTDLAALDALADRWYARANRAESQAMYLGQTYRDTADLYWSELTAIEDRILALGATV